MADQQKGITPQIVAVDELLLQELILLSAEWAWELLRGVGNVLATDQVGEERKLLGPSQFGEDGAQGKEQVDIVGRGERRRMERRRDIQPRRWGSRRSWSKEFT